MNGGAQAHARSLLAVGRPDTAISTLMDALQSDPENVDLLCMLAIAHTQADSPGDALLTAQRAVSLAPDQFEPHLVHGYALQRLDKHKAAVEAFDEALRRHPSSPRALAAKSISQRLRAAPLPVTRPRRLAAKRDRLLQGALANAEAAVSMHPSSADNHITLAQAQHALGRPFAARKTLRHALSLEPNSARANLVLADVQHELGDTRSASAALVQAGKLDARAGREAMRKLKQLGRPVATGGGIGILGIWGLARVIRLINDLVPNGATGALVWGAIIGSLIACGAYAHARDRRAVRRQFAPEAQAALLADLSTRPKRKRRHRRR